VFLLDEQDAKNVHEHAMIQMMSVRPTSMQKKNRKDAVAHEKTHLPNDRNGPTIGSCQEHDFILNCVAKLRSQTFQKYFIMFKILSKCTASEVREPYKKKGSAGYCIILSPGFTTNSSGGKKNSRTENTPEWQEYG